MSAGIVNMRIVNLQDLANVAIADGDKGDITVSGGGATWTIDAGAVSYAKIQNVSATDKILGRSTAGAGVIEEITCTSAARALLDDVDAAAMRTTLGAGTGDVTAASNFGTDNVLLRSDGTGKGAQATGISVADTTDAVSGLGTITPKGTGQNCGSSSYYWTGVYTKDLVIGSGGSNAISWAGGSYLSSGGTTVNLGVSGGSGDIDFDAYALYAKGSGVQRGMVPAMQVSILDADRTLTSTTSQQAIFAAGYDTFTVSASTTYFFEAFLHLSGMSATSGNLTFSIVGSGSATFTACKWIATGLDSSTPTTAAASGTSLSTSATGSGNIVTAGTGTEAVALVKGSFRVNAGGTIIPSIGLTTATAATMEDQSWFQCWPAGPGSMTTIGGS